jgi:hypothetical protein
MGDWIGALGTLALATAGLTLWVASRRSERVWRRSVGAFGTVSSPAFARGFAGGAVLVYLGLLCQGLGGLLLLVAESRYGPGSPRVGPYEYSAAVLMLLAFCGVVFGFVVSWLGRPRWLFPLHARHEPPPWRQVLEERRLRRRGPR